MIKKFFMLAVAALALVACGGDDESDNSTPEPSKATEFVSTLSMTASQDLLDVANVTVYYIGWFASHPCSDQHISGIHNVKPET